MHKYLYTRSHIFITFITIIRAEWNMTYSCFILKKKWAQYVVLLYSDRTDIDRKAKPVLPTLATVSRPSWWLKQSKATSSKTSNVILSLVECQHWRQYVPAPVRVLDEQWVAALPGLKAFLVVSANGCSRRRSEPLQHTRASPIKLTVLIYNVLSKV